MRYPVMNLGRRYRMGVSASYDSAYGYAKTFKDAVDNRYGEDAIQNASQAFNNAMDNAIKNGESGYNLMTDMEKAGIPWDYLKSLRPDLLINSFTHEYFGPAGTEPAGTHIGPTETGGTNPFKPQGARAKKGTLTEGGSNRNTTSGPTPEEEAEARAAWPNEEYGPGGGGAGEQGPAYSPVATSGNAHSYEEEAAQYKQQMEEFQKASKKAKDEADAQIKASNEATQKAMDEMKAKYESGDPNAVCGPGEFWDGRSCRGSGGRGSSNVVSQAMNLWPSGGAAGGITPGDLPPGVSEGLTSYGMGSRFPVVNIRKR